MNLPWPLALFLLVLIGLHTIFVRPLVWLKEVIVGPGTGARPLEAHIKLRRWLGRPPRGLPERTGAVAMSERKPWQVIHVSGSAWWDVMDGSDLVARFTNSKDAHQVVADHNANLEGADANCQTSKTPTCNQAPVDAGAVVEPVAWQWRAGSRHWAHANVPSTWQFELSEKEARCWAKKLDGEVRPLYASLQDDGWQPIETAPRNGTPIILAAAHEGWVAEGFFETHDGRWYEANSHWTDAHDGTCEPTHWRPLPPA